MAAMKGNVFVWTGSNLIPLERARKMSQIHIDVKQVNILEPEDREYIFGVLMELLKDRFVTDITVEPTTPRNYKITGVVEMEIPFYSRRQQDYNSDMSLYEMKIVIADTHADISVDGLSLRDYIYVDSAGIRSATRHQRDIADAFKTLEEDFIL